MVRLAMCISPLLLLTLCSCSTAPEPAAGMRYEDWSHKGVDYPAVRPHDTEALRQSDFVADVTLLDLDRSEADALLHPAGSSDFSPRLFAEPVGETLAVFAVASARGRVVLRPSLPVRPGEALVVENLSDLVYLADWIEAGARRAPKFETLTTGVSVKIQVGPEEDGVFRLQVDSDLSQVSASLKTVYVGDGECPIQLPEWYGFRHQAAQTVQPGETAVFPLGRSGTGDRVRTMLLCVRIERRR